MTKNPLVSIAIPLFNVRNYIEKCARSIFEQSYSNLEYIFVDDCSPDDSVEILKKIILQYPSLLSKIKILTHDENMGLFAARKTAIDSAVGEYLFHVDSDDYLEYDAIERLVEKSEGGKYDIVLGSFSNIYANGSTIYRQKDEKCKLVLISDIIKRKRPTNIWGNLIRKSLYYNLEIPPINNGEDYVTMPRLLYNAKFITFLDVPIYNYTHLNPYAFQFNRDNPKNIKDKIKATDYLFEYFKKNESCTIIMDSINVSRLLLFAYSIIYANSVSELRSIEKISIKKKYFSELKITHRIVVSLYYLRAYSILLLINRVCMKIKNYGSL